MAILDKWHYGWIFAVDSYLTLSHHIYLRKTKPHDERLTKLLKDWLVDGELLNEGIQKGWIESVNKKGDLVERVNCKISLQNRGFKEQHWYIRS